MAISFKNALGIHEQALMLRNQRTQVLANNIANLDTPGYKARDINFEQVLRKHADASRQSGLRTTSSNHIGGGAGSVQVTLSNRAVGQPSMDGNTVDEQIENAAFAKNALAHQASFQFLNGKFTGLMKALRGE